MTVFAYLRVSLDSLTTENQRSTITDAGFAVDEWISEGGVSGSTKALERPAFQRMMRQAKAGDTCLCTMVDRLGRSASDVLHTVEEFKRLGIKLRIMQFDGIDVTSSMGKLVLTVMAACAELERNLLIERTQRAMKRIKDEGVIKLGPPLKITPEKLTEVFEDKAKGMTLDEMSHKHSFHRNTLQKAIVRWYGKLGEYTSEYKAREVQHTSEKCVVRRIARQEEDKRKMLKAA